MSRVRWLMLVGLALVAAVALSVFDARGGDDERQRVAERVGDALVDLPGAVELRRIEPAPEGGGMAYAGEVRDARGTRLRFGVVVNAELADTHLQRILPDLRRAGGGENWLLVSDANADPRLARQRSRLQAQVIAAVRPLVGGASDAP